LFFFEDCVKEEKEEEEVEDALV